MCVCVCVCERERERDRAGGINGLSSMGEDIKDTEKSGIKLVDRTQKLKHLKGHT